MTYASHERWIEIGRYSQGAEAESYALALAAVGISCRLVPGETGIGLFVTAHNVPQARKEIVEYSRENRRPSPVSSRSPSDGLTAALTYCAVLVFTHVASDRQLFGVDWWSAGYAKAGLIVGGEWWRAITALGLHADLGHLASNIVAGGVLGVLLAQSLGPGLAWFAILLAAGIGNELNAFVQPAEHTAVGASTAVFAALGILSALMWRRQATRWARGLRRWLPLAAGVTLLGYLGIGDERTDVLAHVTGFSVGVAFGTGLNLVGPRVPQGRIAQRMFASVAFALYWLAWLMALRFA